MWVPKKPNFSRLSSWLDSACRRQVGAGPEQIWWRALSCSDLAHYDAVPVEALIHKVVGMVQKSQNALLRAGRRCCARPGAAPGWPQDASLRSSRRKTKWKHSFNFLKPRLVIKTSFESSQKVIPRSNSPPGRDEQSCVTKVSTSKDDPPACSSWPRKQIPMLCPVCLSPQDHSKDQ